jgi:uncharacterized protein YndB with AHSA1/START domain
MSLEMSLPHRLDRTVTIQASRATVFRFFTDEARWAAWWGTGSTIDPQPGGQMRIRYPDGTEVSGEIIEVHAPDRIVFSYGYTSGKPIPPGGSRVTIRLEAHGGGTRLQLSHEFAAASVRDDHAQGWRYQLSLFANVVADEVNAGAAGSVDVWFGAWSEPDTALMKRALSQVADDEVCFRDRFAQVAGLADLVDHIAAAQRFMPGIRMERRGGIRHCQGTALVDWAGLGTDGQERFRGTNVFVFGPTGRIESVTGILVTREIARVEAAPESSRVG